MNQQFVFAASSICLIVGLALCFLPAARYFQKVSVGAFGTLLILMGVVLMTTFKWTEVAIKISGLEVRLAKAEQDANEAKTGLAMVQKAVTPQAKTEALQAILTTYTEVSKSTPSDAQVADFSAALDKAKVTVIPLQALSGIGGLQTGQTAPMK